MIKVDKNHQFDWLTVPPESWPKQYAQLEGKCGPCGLSVLGGLVTNARGSWEHFDCAEAAYRRVHGASVYIGTQRQLVEFLHTKHTLNRVEYIPDGKRDCRYRWSL